MRAIVHGRVQGVFFRSFVATSATKLGLFGYVRNLRDGTVEVYAEGEKEQLEELIEHLKVGSPAAMVAKVTTNWSEYTGNYSSFKISY